MQMRLFRALVLCIIGCMWVLSPAHGQLKKVKLRCPVSNKSANEKHTASYRGGSIYFHDEKSRRIFTAKRLDHATNANAQLAASGQAKQIACPITGRKVSGEPAFKVAGTRVAFCCISCLGKVTAAKENIRLYLVFGNNAFTRGFKVKRK